MSRIPFIEARFFDADETQINIEHRLLNHQHKLRAARLISLKNNPDLEGADPDLLINEQTTRTITRRAKRLLERREAASGLSHLKRDDRERLEVLREGVALIQITSEHQADELAANLHAEIPWIAPGQPRSSGRRRAARSARVGRACACRPFCSTARPASVKATGQGAWARCCPPLSP